MDAPKLRYMSSRFQLLDWITSKLDRIQFSTVLDAFGKNGLVSYALKAIGKEVTFNDIYKHNYHIGKAIIENSSSKLTESKQLMYKNPSITYNSFISDTYKGMYYTDEENYWLDIVTQNVEQICLTCPYFPLLIQTFSMNH